MDKTQMKIKRVARGLYVFLTICLVLVCISPFVLLGIYIFQRLGGAFQPSAPISGPGSEQMTGAMYLSLLKVLIPFLLILACGIANFIIIIIMLATAGSITRDISKAHSPFKAGHAKKLRRIARCSIALAASGLLLFVCVLSISWGTYLGFSPAFPLEQIIFAVLFYLLALIFEYGHSLQTLEDETL